MDKLKDMQLFCEVVERGNFAKAAKKIGVTPAIVGRRVASLENQLGFILLNRTTRTMTLTPSGKAYYEGAKKIIENIGELEEALGMEHHESPRGNIRLSAPDGLGNPFLVDTIKAFQEKYPNIRFDLLLQNNQVDLVEQSIDLAFRFSFDLQDSSYIATKFGETTFGLYAAPSYLAKHGVPTSIKELDSHQCIHMGENRYGDYWNLKVDGQNVTYRQPWSIVVSNTDSLKRALTSGMGIGIVPRLFMNEELENNTVREIGSITEFPTIGIYGIYPTRKHLPHRLRLFLDFLKEHFASKL